MTKKEQSEKVIEIIKNYKSSSNKDLKFALDFIKEDFDNTKNMIIKLSHHFDKLEVTYNTLHKEHENRLNKK